MVDLMSWRTVLNLECRLILMFVGLLGFRRVENYALSTTSVLILILAQSPYDLGALGTIALVPWLIAVSRSGPVEAIVIGMMVGVAYAIVGTGWLFAAFQSQGANGLRGVMGVLIAALWGKGLLFGLIGWLVQQLHGRGTMVRVIAPAALFGLAEHWISSSPWGLPLLLLGHSQRSVPGVAQLAVVVGVPGISMLLFLVNAAVASVFAEGPSRIRGAVAWGSLWWTLAMGGMPIARAFEPGPGSSSKTLLIIQPDIPVERRWDAAYQTMILDEIAAETSRAIELLDITPHAILWPENLLTSPVTPGTPLGRRLQIYVNGWDAPVVTGLVREPARGDRGRYRNSAIWWSPLIGPRDVIDKVRAIPLIESSRKFWGSGLLANLIGEAAKGSKVEEARVARPLRGEFTLSPALCFEVLFPRIVADRRDEESVAIVNLADDSWVPGEVLDRQLVAASSFRAIEQRLTLIRVSHGGLSVVINRYGKEIASLEPDTVAHLLVETSAAPAPSWHEKAAILLLPGVAGPLIWTLFAPVERRLERL